MGHTPGPWHANGDCIEADGPGGPRDVTVAVATAAPSGSDIASNARLIAAAPELLAALRLARDDLSDLLEVADLTDEGVADTTEVLNTVIAAIAKAEGRTND